MSFTTGWSDHQHLAKWSSLAVPTAIRGVKHEVPWHDAGVNRQYPLCGILARNVWPHVYHEKKVTWIKKVEHYMGIFKWFDAIKNHGKYYRLNNQLQCMNLDSGSWTMEERSQLRKSVYRKHDAISELMWTFLGSAIVVQLCRGWPNSWEMHAEVFRSEMSWCYWTQGVWGWGVLFKNETWLSLGSFTYLQQVNKTGDSHPKLCLPEERFSRCVCTLFG